MKKHFRLIPFVLFLSFLLPISAGAVHNSVTWKTLNDAGTFDEPFTDYDSVFDETQEKYLFSEYEKDLFALRDQFPDLMRLEVIGHSELGRPLYAVVMGQDTAPQPDVRHGRHPCPRIHRRPAQRAADRVLSP